MKKLAQACCYLVFVFVVAAKASEPDVERDFSRALSLMTGGFELEAHTSFTDFIRRYPQHSKAPLAQYYVGEIQFKRSNFEDSEKDLKKIFGLSQASAELKAKASLKLGELYLKTKRPFEARIEWEAVKRHRPQSGEAKQAQIFLEGMGGS